MADKAVARAVKICGLTPAQGNIIKQESLACGIDAAVCRGTVNCAVERTDVLIIGTERGLKALSERLAVQPFNLPETGIALKSFLTKSKKRSFFSRGREFSLEKPLVMGIFNVTPDSFSDGGMLANEERVKAKLALFASQGADITDIGGESTRPGSDAVSLEEELARILPAVKLAKEMDLFVSVDTYKSKTALKALEKGADMINDISGLTFDSDMAKVCADFGAAVCLMHIKGEPKSMQEAPSYANLLEEVKSFLYDSADAAVKAGVREDSIILDPGFGFGKTLKDNHVILKYLEEFTSMGFPLLAGMSRKSMIGGITGKPPQERLIGTKSLEAVAVFKGADIIRSHDVAETAEMIKVVDYLRKAGCDA
ncbi:dihydropteroate synthase [Geovibrio thiophilus]|uniref:Dihydropteroate synthase n=2 Tax=Geovibrio thiophilus TaxID=139438 RepID=A0A3R6B011_9BACT|nr:dihydropteroate synthase [Geovibrio thiophilus]